MTLTSERHGASCLGEHLDTSCLPDFVDFVAHGVAAVFATLEAHATVEHVIAPAAVRPASFLLVQQGIDEQMDGPLMLASDGIIHG